MTRRLRVMIIVIFISVGLILTACTILNGPRFGKLPKGDQLQNIKTSEHYADGEFKNIEPTPLFAEGVSTFSVMWSNITDKNDRLIPEEPIPVVKTDLKALDTGQDAVVWLGHSSWFIQISGQRILIDPVFSHSAAPFSFANKAFEGTNIYTADDMPDIDFLLITHDHWDHLDYPSIIALRDKVKKVICPLGVGANFEYWDYKKEKIQEGDWYDSIASENGLTIHIMPARHYSGRLFERNKTFWCGFAFISPKLKIFFSGDSGYGEHFSKIESIFKDFDLALLDMGQYDSRWPYIHMTPEEAARAAEVIHARAVIPAHVGRFSIANHAWDEPFIRMTKTSQDKSFYLLTPVIGQPFVPASADFKSGFPRWWEEVE